jgi:type VI secretion system protein ImpM
MSEHIALPAESAGFFGKVTTHGDFVTRRLPESFRQPWDDWLQQGIQGSRQSLGPAWLDLYLTSPIWRFALAPGVCDRNAWAGIVMPSVDRVGRHFPLTITAGVAGAAPLTEWLENASPWYDRLEHLALSSLSADFLLEDFDQALQAMLPLPPATASALGQSTGHCFPLSSLDGIAAVIPALTTQLAGAALVSKSLWWTEGSSQVIPSLLLCDGLPTAMQFTGMLDGAWQQRDWHLMI